MKAFTEFVLDTLKVAAAITLLGFAFVTISILGGCEGFIRQNLEDGYQFGDVTAGATADVEWYCDESRENARQMARYMAALAGVPVADLCPAMRAAISPEESTPSP